jgi:hypothetical protein
LIALATYSIGTRSDVIAHTVDSIGLVHGVTGINSHVPGIIACRTAAFEKTSATPRRPSSLIAEATALVGYSIDTTPLICSPNPESTVIGARPTAIVGNPAATAREATAAFSQATATTTDSIATTRRTTTLNAEVTAIN